MSIEIKMYVHGVLTGQDIWGNPDRDRWYIENFYSSSNNSSNMPARMLVEMKTIGDNNYCYYTYILDKNVYGEGGRPGSYVAITLRLNSYYSDIQNIYHILEYSFKKFLIGIVVERVEQGIRYKVSSFRDCDTMLNLLDKELKNYLMQFSSNSDFIGLGVKKIEGYGQMQNIYLGDCSVQRAFNCMKSVYHMCVSQYYDSEREQKKIKEANDRADERIRGAEIRAEKKVIQAEQKVEDSKKHEQQVERDCKEKIYKNIEETSIEIARIKKEAEAKINSIKAVADTQIKDAEKRKQDAIQKQKMAEETLQTARKDINRLNVELDKSNKQVVQVREESNKLSAIIQNLKKEVESYKPYMSKYEEKCKEIEELGKEKIRLEVEGKKQQGRIEEFVRENGVLKSQLSDIRKNKERLDKKIEKLEESIGCLEFDKRKIEDILNSRLQYICRKIGVDYYVKSRECRMKIGERDVKKIQECGSKNDLCVNMVRRCVNVGKNGVKQMKKSYFEKNVMMDRGDYEGPKIERW